MSDLNGKTILVGVSGGIAAYKTCTLVSALVQNGATVYVCMTKNAAEFVTPLTFETLSRNRVVVDTFDRDFTWEVEHVALAKKADFCVIAPATANVIAKIACGVCDDFLTTTVLALKCPVMIAPSMNTAMLENPVTQKNIFSLKSRGFMFIDGSSGYLACGDKGAGRMAEPTQILQAIIEYFSVKQDFAGKKILVTAGSTRADIDPVRFLTNRSSGKMGVAIANAAKKRGADVVLITGYADAGLITENGIERYSVRTTAEMFDEVKKHLPSCDISVFAAAPCDYEITPSQDKIKSNELELTLKKAPDCAKWAGKHKGNGKTVIFAAETADCISNAKSKLAAKNADMVVLNDVTKKGAGFDVDTNIVTIITANGERELPLMSKTELAQLILDNAVKL